MRISLCIALLCCFLLESCVKEKPRVLVFSKTKGFRHLSIEPGKVALQKLGAENNFDVDTTEDASAFREENLRRYSAVVFLNTTGDVLDVYQQNAFKRFIQAGGGFVGVHAAADTEYDWWWYGKLVGAYFKSHPEPQKVRVLKVAPPSKEMDLQVPDPWERTDELYNYRRISDDLNVLFKLDESSYKGGENGEDHPWVWYHDFDGGRAFYTGMGHTDESYSEPEVLAQLKMGIEYAIGENDLNYSKVSEEITPEDNRFSKVVFDYNFDEPTEMTILPDGRIIFLERKGAVKLFDPGTDTVLMINKFNVNTTFEDGMIGLTRDPDFAKNNFLYIFYSHPTRSANVLSRFTFNGKEIDMSSEKELLEVVTQRQTCCHTGGSLAFGPDGNLFISTGDNTSPFESDGYSPADERSGRAPFDAQKSSANPNDLRGKILRIHPEADGTYTIPDGNLFGKDEQGTRPEVYVMGCRNPYRISVDSRTGYLYWGEVGPDAGNDSQERGPRGYDEVNQARGPGFFGWPLFVGGNFAYAKYDFASKAAGEKHNPERPINSSPNNTGKQELPAVSPPFIYYPYAESPDFPLMKTGGRNAMAGPVYYSEKFKEQPNAFPSYLDGKLIIYEWMRNWVRLVTMDDEGNITEIEPFMDNIQFNNLTDMEFGPDGKLYTLEYGTKWFAQNMDARLSVIEFNKGNRAPNVTLTSDVLRGAVPLTANLSAAGSNDPDNDPVKFEFVVDGKTLTSDDGNLTYTFDSPGIYRPKVTVTDDKGVQSSSELTIVAGNEPPVVDIDWKGNKDFFFYQGNGSYTVNVSDKEDGTTADGQIAKDRVTVTFDYLPQGYDMTNIAQGHQRSEMPGKILIAESDCKSCHLIDEKSAGPSYKMIAAKYGKEQKAIEVLSEKILKGGSGVWGDVPMAAHPQITKQQAGQMVEYILALGKEQKVNTLPVSGSVKFDKPLGPMGQPQGAYILTASYEDKGNGTIPSTSSEKAVVLTAPVIRGEHFDELNGPSRFNIPTGGQALQGIKHASSASTKAMDLTGVASMGAIVIEIGPAKGGTIDVYLDSREGKKLGTFDMINARRIPIQSGINMVQGQIRTPGLDGQHRLVLVFNNEKAGDADLFMFGGVTLSNK
jgi:cytochrome c